MSRLTDLLRRAAKQWVFRYFARRPGMWIICCHSVVASHVPYGRYRTRNALTVDEFRKLLDIIDLNFSYVHSRDLGTLLTTSLSRGIYRGRHITLTFDDGYMNNYTLAAPLLAAHGLSALFAVVTGHVGQRRLLWPHLIDEVILQGAVDFVDLPLLGRRVTVPREIGQREALATRLRKEYKGLPNSQRRRLMKQWQDSADALSIKTEPFDELYAFMGWDNLRALASQGHVIASHTVTHPILSTLDESELTWELYHSKHEIESALDGCCNVVSYPNGRRSDYSSLVIKKAQECGYAIGLTTSSGVNRQRASVMELKRVSPKFVLLGYS